MSKKPATKKAELVRVGNTPVARIALEGRKKLHKLMKKRLAVRRNKYPEVRGKVVD